MGNGYFTFGTGTGNSRVYNGFGSNASWTRVSDQRYKKDIQNNTNCVFELKFYDFQLQIANKSLQNNARNFDAFKLK